MLACLLSACTAVAPPPTPVAETPHTPVEAPPKPRVVPVEAEPQAPAANPLLSFFPYLEGPRASALAYAEKLKTLSPPELAAEIARLGDPGDAPMGQMQLALALAQTRAPADLAKALALMQRVAHNNSPEARSLQPLARVLVARFIEQRRVEDERDRLAAQLRDSQRRVEQLTERLEALRAIERSVSRPNSAVPLAPPAAGGAHPPRTTP